jgi:hypothetical protein
MDHPLMRYVDLQGISIFQAKSVALPDWASRLARSEGGELIFAGETGGRRVAVLTFDLHDSDLPLRVAFPVLASNLLNYLAPAQAVEAEGGLQPGERLSILPEPDVTEVDIVSPGGAVYQLSPGETALLFEETGELGLYAVNYIATGRQWADFFAVNLFNPQESDIHPAGSIQVGQSPVTASTQQELGQLEFWPWLAAAGLGALVLEWLVYHRKLLQVTR